jgi:hypothetical protein
MRWAPITAVAFLAAVGCGSASSAPAESAAAEPVTSLAISFWDEGRDQGEPKRWTLRCGPVGGTHTRRASACTRLGSLQRPFAPPQKDLLCTQIFGGPQQALITGKHRGQRVWAQLSLTDGCQIARFQKLAFLVPGLAVGPGGTTR